jgi:hypothetical protein
LSQLAIDLAQLDRSTVKYFQHKRKDVEVYISSGIRYIDWEKVHQPKNDPLPASLKTKDIKNALIHLATEIAYEKEEDNGIHKQEVTKLFDPLFKSPALAKLKSLGKHIWENHKQEISKDYTIRAKPVIQHELTVQTTATIFYCFYRKNQTIENAWTDQVSIRIKTKRKRLVLSTNLFYSIPTTH